MASSIVRNMVVPAILILAILGVYKAYLVSHKPPVIDCEFFQDFALSGVPATLSKINALKTIVPGTNYTVEGRELEVLKALSVEPGVERICMVLVLADYKKVDYTITRIRKYVDGGGAVYYESSTEHHSYYKLVRKEVVGAYSLEKVPQNVTRIVIPVSRLPEAVPGTTRLIYVWVTGLPHGACDEVIINGDVDYISGFLPTLASRP